jgi:hypothetical protein
VAEHALLTRLRLFDAHEAWGPLGFHSCAHWLSWRIGSAYELVVITTKEQLEKGPDGVGGYLRDGTPVPLQIARMLACDGARVDVTMSEHGELLDVGRRTRAIPSATTSTAGPKVAQPASRIWCWCAPATTG